MDRYPKCEVCSLDPEKVTPFGAQYFTESRVDSPGPVRTWSWQPANNLVLDAEESASWPGTTGTGPTAKEDERYAENQ
jgi:hypothetical protein